MGPRAARAAMMRAVRIAHDAGREVAFTLSESVCIAGRKEGFAAMIESGGIDLLFANEDEAMQLTGAADLRAALDELSAKVPTLVVTRGAVGALAVKRASGCKCRRSRSTRWSTRPARGICSRPDFSPRGARGTTSSKVCGPARSRPAKSSRISVRGPKPI